MPSFLIDVNLPYYFSLWNNPDFIHQKDINEEAADEEIWEYAVKNNLTIITKDADFSNRILLNTPPPKVIHIRFGNIKLKDFYLTLTKLWGSILELNKQYKLVNVFKDRIQGIN